MTPRMDPGAAALAHHAPRKDAKRALFRPYVILIFGRDVVGALLVNSHLTGSQVS